MSQPAFEESSITLYGKSNCMPCRATKRKLEQLGKNFSYVDIEQDNQAFDYVKKIGYNSVPVIVYGNEAMGYSHFSGFQPDAINAL